MPPRQPVRCLAACLLAIVLAILHGQEAQARTPAPIQAQTQTQAPARTLEQVRSAGLLRVCVWPDYFGIGSRHPRSGELQGLDIDLSRALAADLGVRVEHVETDFGRFADDLSRRRCEVAMMGVGVTAERRARVAFTRAYLRSDVYAVVSRHDPKLRGWEDLDRAGRVIAVQRGTYMEPLMRGRLREARLLVVERPGERERAVESGRADAFITDYPYSRRVLASADWARVIAPPSPVQITDYAYAVAQGDAQWLERLDAFVLAIRRDGRLAAAAQRHGLSAILALD
jgi:cyclohexadienyl dehydratase